MASFVLFVASNSVLTSVNLARRAIDISHFSPLFSMDSFLTALYFPRRIYGRIFNHDH